MEQPFSTSKVTVEYFDPHDVYKLLAPGLIPRLPLRNLHWRSHVGPPRSIDTLHVELVAAGTTPSAPVTSPGASTHELRSDSSAGRDDGFTTQALGGSSGSGENGDAREASPAASRPTSQPPARRHQIPGLRRTPYLKVLFVRCDDNDTYKSQTRSEIREWIKQNTPPAQSTRRDRSNAENHDAFEWLVIHVVIPNTVAATQPRASGGSGNKGPDASTDSLPTTKGSSTSRWRGGSSSTLLEKLRSDFNSSSKTTPDRILQIRIGINDVPYDMLPRVVPAVPTGYNETEADAEVAWEDLIIKFKELILSSFDMRVSQYEEDIKEKDTQRSLPGWNFCTFFILKEGLARGFESVGLVEDALVGYDELSVGLDTIIQEQASFGSAAAHGGSLLAHTDDLKKAAQKAMSMIATGAMEFEEEPLDLQSTNSGPNESFDDIPIAATKKPYRELILANNVSIFDFRCYIFARQISLLLRLGNAWSTREELLAKLKEQQASILHGVAPRVPPPQKNTEEPENLPMLAEICRRTLEFIPAVSQVMRRDIISAFTDAKGFKSDTEQHLSEVGLTEVVDNMVASFAFSITQQILAQTSTKALPIPPSTLAPSDGEELKSSIPEPKTMMHPARSSSMRVSPGDRPRPPPSPGIFPGPGRRASATDLESAHHQFLKVGLEELAARRAELYGVSRNILEQNGKKRGWNDGWAAVPMVGETGVEDMEEVDLGADSPGDVETKEIPDNQHSIAGLDNRLLRTALDNREDFYRLYETLTDKALRHYTVANHTHSVKASLADLAVLKFFLQEYGAAANYFWEATPFFGESSWSLLELSMLVMYAKCLHELQRKDDFVRVVLKLLSKAAEAEKDRLRHRQSFRISPGANKDYPERSSIRGFLVDFVAVAKSMPSEVKVALESFFTQLALEGAAVYNDDEDSYSLSLKLVSLLPDSLEIDKAAVRLASPNDAGSREIWLESKKSVVLKPGHNRIQLNGSVVVPGAYEVDRIQVSCSNIGFYHEVTTSQANAGVSSTLHNNRVVLYQRTDGLDLRLGTSRSQQLDEDSVLDLELSTGWNNVQTCELRVRAATGGLRLLMSEAMVVDNLHQPTKPPEGGLFCFSSLPANTIMKIRLPFTVEQEISNISVKLEAVYTTERGTFSLVKTPSVSIALALGVNVQDVFKHSFLFSRFSVSTASSSPLRLLKSELVDSDVFKAEFGVAPSNPVMIFPKQPASLMYKITRQLSAEIGSKTRKTMYLRLLYSVFREEIDETIESTLHDALEDTSLRQFSRLIVSRVIGHLEGVLTPYDLERAALLDELQLSFLGEITWERYFAGLGSTVEGKDAGEAIAEFIVGWVKTHSRLPLSQLSLARQEPRSILIPVDVPTISVVHTADIRLQQPVGSFLNTSSLSDEPEDTPTVSVNQLLPATLHLKWTRVWDTEHTLVDTDHGSSNVDDIEFSYEVSAPADTWLLGGRRKGHFVIPAPSSKDDASSTPSTEADIPLLLVPLREGWIPYPSVEVREVRGADNDVAGHGHCEMDYRNLGETVRVVADRERVTVSLDASGPGGGPLVLESEMRRGFAGRIVA